MNNENCGPAANDLRAIILAALKDACEGRPAGSRQSTLPASYCEAARAQLERAPDNQAVLALLAAPQVAKGGAS